MNVSKRCGDAVVGEVSNLTGQIGNLSYEAATFEEKELWRQQ